MVRAFPSGVTKPVHIVHEAFSATSIGSGGGRLLYFTGTVNLSGSSGKAGCGTHGKFAYRENKDILTSSTPFDHAPSPFRHHGFGSLDIRASCTEKEPCTSHGDWLRLHGAWRRIVKVKFLTPAVLVQPQAQFWVKLSSWRLVFRKRSSAPHWIEKITKPMGKFSHKEHLLSPCIKL